MHIRRIIFGVAAAVLLIVPTLAAGQSSLNSYSPYSLYGLGDMSTLGNGNLRAMGGAGTAFRGTHLTPFNTSLNYLNPASYSSMPRQSFLLNVGVEGQSYYLKQGGIKSSYSSINVRDIGVMLPLAKGVGFAFTVTPFSSVGYRFEDKLYDQELQGTVGSITKYYEGDGDVTQFKAGVGVQIGSRMSVGVEAIYLKGLIDRIQEVYFSNEFGQAGFTNTYSSMSEDISKFTFMAGLQYNVISTSKKVLTLGATYRMGIKLNPRMEHYVPSTSNDPDPTYLSRSTGNLELPDEFSIGFYYHTSKLSVGADYTFANWGDRNKNLSDVNVDGDLTMKYTNTSGFRAGVQYTPNRIAVRSFFKRLTYRAGVRYQQSYMEFGGKRIDDKAVTLGVGMPVSYMSRSAFDFGVEYGQRGTTSRNLIKVNYLKFSVGFSFMGDSDFWFVKKKYD